MAKVFTGRDARMYVQLNSDGINIPLAKVTSYSFQSELNLLETTTLGDDIKSFTPSVLSHAGTADLLYYKDDDNSMDANIFLSRYFNQATPYIVQIPLNLLFVINDSPKSHSIRFKNVFLTSVSFGASVGEIVSAKIAFQSSGPIESYGLDYK